MPHLSKEKLEQKILDDLYSKLLKETEGSQQKASFLGVILTETEKIMLSKRFALILMLARGNSFDQITRTLKISPSTIARFSLEAENGKYNNLLKKIGTKNGKVLNTLLSLLTGSMRPIHAPRWKWMNEI